MNWTAPALALLVLASVVPGAAVAAGPSADSIATGDASTADAPTTDTASVSDAPTTDTAAAAASATASPTINVDTALSLTPATPGSIGVVQTFDVPQEVTELRVTLERGVTVSNSTGFRQVDQQTWEWDGVTDSPTLGYAKPANRTAEVSGPFATDGAYLYADVGPWALVRTPNIGLQWRYRGSDAVEVSRSTRIDGEGAVGDTTAFLGAHTVYSRETGDQTVRLVVPEAANLANSPSRILSTLSNASQSMQVGDRDPTVFAVAAPTDRVDWAVKGLQVGSHDFWVRDSERVDEVSNAWLHEYVHTRQSFETANSAKWFTEASATWYAALLSLDEGAMFWELRQFLDRGTTDPQADAVLSDPSTWKSNAHYWKGALVLGELDRRMRLTTDKSASLQTVFRSLNSQTGQVTNEDIVAAIGDAAAPSTEAAADRFTTTSEAPETWNQSAHREAFGTDPATMQLRFDAPSDVRHAGPYRNSTAESPLTVAVGETLSFQVQVTNVGDASGDYEVILRADGDRVGRVNGTLAPGESTTSVLTHQFDETGTQSVSLAGERLDVEVRELATPSVTGLRVNRSDVEAGATVTATATVENDASVPGNRTVVVTLDGEPVETRTVSLAPGEQRTVSAQLELPEAGEYRIGAGDRSVTVQVASGSTAGSDTTDAPDDPPQSQVPVPGFGVPAVIGGLTALVLLTRLRREQ